MARLEELKKSIKGCRISRFFENWHADRWQEATATSHIFIESYA